MNEDFRARLLQKAQAIKAQRDAEAEEAQTRLALLREIRARLDTLTDTPSLSSLLAFVASVRTLLNQLT